MNIEYIKNMNNSELESLILKNKELLLDSNIRSLLMEENRHYAFVWIVQEIDDFSYLSDDDMINRILEDKKFEEKMNAILSSCKNIASLLKNKNFANAILSTNLINYLTYLDYDSSKVLMDYMLNEKLEKYFNYFTNAVKLELIKDERVLNAVLNSDSFGMILKNSSPKLFELFTKFDRTKNIIFNSDVNFIMYFVTNDVAFPLDISLDKKFQQKFLDIKDISFYRFCMDELEKNNSLAASEIDKKRDQIYDEDVKDYSNGLFSKTKSILAHIDNGTDYSSLLDNDIITFLCINNIDETNISCMKDILYKYDSFKMRDTLIDRYFKDVPLNFLKNLNVMVDYNNSLREKIIDKKRLSIYKRILAFEELTYIERKNLYMECQKYENLAELFYDDYRSCRDNSYSNLIDVAINPQNMGNLLSLEKSEKYNIPVYELNGEKFFAFVHVTREYKKNPRTNPNLWRKKVSEGLSLSFIGSNNITTYGSPEDYVAFGFSNLDYNRFVHLRDSDSFSNYNSSYNEHSHYVQKMYTPSNFVKKTLGYNEIVYQENSKKIELAEVKPDYVLCYNEISDVDVNVAQYYHLPIVVVNTKKYKFSKDTIDNSESNKYVDINNYQGRKL